jgi:hypothetical protein
MKVYSQLRGMALGDGSHSLVRTLAFAMKRKGVKGEESIQT